MCYLVEQYQLLLSKGKRERENSRDALDNFDVTSFRLLKSF